jgi:membrane protease YdiL (CAAX protease family)
MRHHPPPFPAHYDRKVHAPFPIVPAAAALILLLAPLFAFAFAGVRCVRAIQSLPVAARLLLPAVLLVPWLIVSLWSGTWELRWFFLYLLVPVLVASLLWLAAQRDPEQRSHLLDYVVLFPLGLAVDLRWLEPAWPHRLALLGKLTLLDAGLYGYLAIRQLSGVGFDLRLRWQDFRIGLREFLFYTTIAIPLGLALSFLHLHSRVNHPLLVVPLWVLSFIGVALPEEVFFRGWMQNLLERRIGRVAALVITACLFGLSHFNKRTTFFNWRYVLLAAIAGIFYGRAWRQDRRIGASAITHATVDTIWGALLR